MSDSNTESDLVTKYQARLVVAALTQCKDREQAAQLMAQYLVLAPRISQTIDLAADLVEAKRYSEAVASLTEMVDRAEQFSRPYPAEAVREVFGYDMSRLYFSRAVALFGNASGAADLQTALIDLDRAQSYPLSCFAEWDPEKPAAMSEFRGMVEAVLKGQKVFEAKQPKQQAGKAGNVSATKSTGCLILVMACGLVGLLGMMLA